MIDRLRELLPATVKVMSVADLAGVASNSQVTPAVHVIYGGFDVLESTSTKRGARVRQTWYAVPVVRNVASQIHGAGARDAASPIIDDVLDALMGWKPNDSFQALEAVKPPAPLFNQGLGYFPLAFTSVTAVGTQQPRTY